jgi:hypothetical protein
LKKNEHSYPEKKKDKFWETLKDILDKISSTSEIFLMGGFQHKNGKRRRVKWWVDLGKRKYTIMGRD